MCLLPSDFTLIALMTEAVSPSETSVSYQTIHRNIPEDIYTLSNEKLKYHQRFEVLTAVRVSCSSGFWSHVHSSGVANILEEHTACIVH
jgi:hypothetical protein